MFSRRARHAMRALLDIVEHGQDRSIQVFKLAEQHAIPRKYLEQIMTDLKKLDILRSQRGPGGGYRLSRLPEQSMSLQIMRAIDGPIALVACASENFYARCGDCHDEASCAIRKVILQVRESAVAILACTLVADAAATEQRDTAGLAVSIVGHDSLAFRGSLSGGPRRNKVGNFGIN